MKWFHYKSQGRMQRPQNNAQVNIFRSVTNHELSQNNSTTTTIGHFKITWAFKRILPMLYRHTTAIILLFFLISSHWLFFIFFVSFSASVSSLYTFFSPTFLDSRPYLPFPQLLPRLPLMLRLSDPRTHIHYFIVRTDINANFACILKLRKYFIKRIN